MKVGIIGYRGFVGSAIHGAFSADKKYEAVGIGRDSYGPLKGTEFDILINANGNSDKRLAESDPRKDFEMNVLATLDSLFDFPCGHYVHISTIDVYPDRGGEEATREDAAIDPGRLSNYGLSKYLAEQVVRKYAKSWLILRLGGVVGSGMKKGPAYDMLELGKLFISEKSRYQYLNSADAANLAKRLVEMGKFGEAYNLVGKGNIALGEIARMAGVALSETGSEVQVFDASCRKLSGVASVPSTRETVERFVKGYKRA